MPKKITQEEAEQKSLDVGMKMMGKYVNNRTKTEFICPTCKNIFISKPNNIWNQHTTGCCQCSPTRLRTQQEANANDQEVGAKRIEPYRNSKVPTLYKCSECDQQWKIRPIDVWCKKINICSECGHIRSGKCRTLSQEEAERKSLSVGIKMIEDYQNSSTKINFICPVCQNIFSTYPNNVWTKKTTKCQRCANTAKYTQEEAKAKSLFVGIEMVGEYQGSYHKINFRCPVCNNIFITHPHNIWTQNTKSCGNCQLKRNGITTSYKALELHDQIIKHGRHNHKIIIDNKTIYIDIAGVWNGKKIAIEYDEWFNHGYKTQKDLLRLRKLQKRGWKTLRIKAANNLPTQEQLDNAINKLAYTKSKSVTITLPGWGKGNTRFPIENK